MVTLNEIMEMAGGLKLGELYVLHEYLHTLIDDRKKVEQETVTLHEDEREVVA